MASELVGGQALVEGVMMRCGTEWAAATRRADGTIATTRGRRGHAFAAARGIPVLRGVGALVDSLRIGSAAMSWSRTQSAEPDSVDPTSPRRSETLVVVGVVAAVLAAFVLVPLGSAGALRGVIGTGSPAALVEGLVRLAMFVAYLVVLSRLEGIRRTLGYHGAEHMVIAAYEDGEPPTIQAARRHGVRHPRCGTDFFLLIFVISIVAFALVGRLPALWLVASRVAIAPLVVGVAYEVLRAAGTAHDSSLGRAFAAPGLWLQRFTTREPGDDQIEVALAALGELGERAVDQSTNSGIF